MSIKIIWGTFFFNNYKNSVGKLSPKASGNCLQIQCQGTVLLVNFVPLCTPAPSLGKNITASTFFNDPKALFWIFTCRLAFNEYKKIHSKWLFMAHLFMVI